MSTLRDITRIEYQITHSNLKIVKTLHIICFGNEGEPRKVRKALREFSGFGYSRDSVEYTAKLEEIKKLLELPDLIAICNILDLDYNGNENEIADRICSFLIDLKAEQRNDDLDEETEDEKRSEQSDDIGETEQSDRENTRKRTQECHRGMDSFALTFRDVEDSIRPFDGKEEYPVKRWIADFEEIADVTGWNELQKLLFAKRSLKGLAKLFIQAEKGIKTWSILKERLIKEFEIKINSAQIHKMLMSRKKKQEESVQEYVLAMREIASRGNTEPEVVIQYIIDGIQDETSNKIILYGAKDFSEFKEKAKLYESILSKKSMPSKNSSNVKKDFSGRYRKDTKREIKKETDVTCFNCGGKGHKSRDCPDKSKGIKCFGCNGYGHVATRCPNRTSTRETPKPSTSTNMSVMEVVPKNAIKLKIDNTELTALLDTGSDISVIREDVYEAYFQNITLANNYLTVRGLGENKILTLGSFCRNVIVNDEKFLLTFHVIPKAAACFRAIVGNNLLEQAEVSIGENGIMVYKRKESFLMHIKIADDEEEKDEIDLNHIANNECQQTVKELIHKYEPQKTKTTDIKMRIVLKNEEVIYQRPRRLSVPEKIEVEKQIDEWLENGIVRASSSEFACPIVLVKKKDGKTRICCDYRKLNKNLVKDRFPLPLIEDVLDGLQGAKIFSTIDLRNGFFHVPIEEDSIKYTAFVTHNGQYEFLKCPFGLSTSPPVFQRFINHIFRPLLMENIVIYYMDDIIIPSCNYEEGLERLKMVLQVAKEYGLEIKKEKCQFLKERIEFLGFIIEDGKVQPCEAKTYAIRKFPEPTTCRQLQSFLGLTGYFRKFIPSHAIIAKPLSDMLKKNQSFIFEDVQKQAFNRLKDLLTSEPILHIFQQGRETELHTDASKFGYGACLMQRDSIDSKFHPIYYMSKKTTPAEEKYSSYELEVLAIIQAVKKFRIYLLGTKFKIITDCSAFQKTMNKRDLTTRVARWALLLEEYDYEIEHRKGSKMSHVDALSRNPVVMTIINKEEGMIERLKLAQEKDERIITIKKVLMTEEYDNYFVKHDILYKYENGQELIVPPKTMQTEIIRRAHEVGHFSVKKTEEMINREFYIPKLKEKIQTVIGNCIPCILGNRKEGKKEGFLHPISKQEGPLHTYHIDHLGPIPSTNKNYKYILAVIDDFSKFAWLYPTKSTTSKETVSCLLKQQKTFGNPTRIITDKGTAFTANEFEDYCTEEGIIHVTITTGVPRGNGQVERLNRTIISVLTKLSSDDPTKWYKFVDRVQSALNSTYQRSIATSPFEILIGVKMKTKEDILLREMIEQETLKQFDAYREELRTECKQHLLKAQEENRKKYNLRRKEAKVYKVGDLVAIKRTQFGTGLKISSNYLGPYEITQAKPHERYNVARVGNHVGPLYTSTCAEYLKPWVENLSESETDS